MTLNSHRCRHWIILKVQEDIGEDKGIQMRSGAPLGLHAGMQFDKNKSNVYSQRSPFLAWNNVKTHSCGWLQIPTTIPVVQMGRGEGERQSSKVCKFEKQIFPQGSLKTRDINSPKAAVQNGNKKTLIQTGATPPPCNVASGKSVISPLCLCFLARVCAEAACLSSAASHTCRTSHSECLI